jgi:hypothetical protein
MRAGSCIIAAAMVAAPMLANGSARAETTDPQAVKPAVKPEVAKPAVVKKDAKPSKSKAKPDKNQYWLLNPVPPDQMRVFNTDRPLRSGTFSRRTGAAS